VSKRAVAVVTALWVVLSACGGSESGGAAGADPLREGRSLYGDACSVCHGPRGEGGVGPSLEAVVETWPDCDSQVEWISLGSEGWRAAYGDTYGASAAPVEGGMPAQGDQMTGAEIRRVAAFERVEYGGQDRAAALADCGIE
jgi:mono/diheme cytochrome c family protein